MDQQPSTWHYHADKPNGRKKKSKTTVFRRKANTSQPRTSVTLKHSSSTIKTETPPTNVKSRSHNSAIPLGKFFVFIILLLFIGVGAWSLKPLFPRLISFITQQNNAITAGNSSGIKDIGGTCVIRSGEEKLPDSVKQALSKWFITTFNATAQLKTPDLSALYSSDTDGTLSRLLDETALDYLSTVRSLQSVDLTLTGFEIGLTILDCSDDGNGNYRVTLMEDDQVQFSCLDGRTSSSCDIYHEFLFSSDGLILYHEKTEDGFTLIRELYENEATDSPQETLQQIRDTLVQTAQVDIASLNTQRSNYASEMDYIESIAPTAQHPYNRENAVAYAHEWAGTTTVLRNNNWGIYDIYGGNCNNFTSQCLYAGGIPMDIYGHDAQQWKWYGETLNSNNDASGRSYSWSGVDEFFAYVQQNSGYGLVAQTDINVYAAQPGDVLQYEADGEWKHSVLVVEVLTDQDGQPVDFLIASNTTDRIDWPMSAYAYTNVRLIHILGYNT